MPLHSAHRKVNSRGVTVLVVDDEPGVRSALTRLLQLNGFSVLEARNGEVALELLREHPEIDLLLVDVVMPVLGGTIVAELARRMRPNLRVLFMSGHVEDASLRACLAGEHFLQKPFNVSGLLHGVEHALNDQASSAA